ncbi:MAG: hypothetical protein EAX86_12065 [Candidatus Heimdallarchaeota archaeon]|nr:hypothetical protein [Candidatus Heimdallarchaeota archaeon]
MASNSETPIIGIIVSSFSDAGPIVIFNSSKQEISEDQALNLSIRVMTVIGEQSANELYGPFPVPSNDELQCLTYVFRVKSTFTTDPRLSERPTVITIIFKRILKREISRAHGLILSYLSQITLDFKNEDDLTSENMMDIHKRLSALISTNPVRVYSVENDKIQEHTETLEVPLDAFAIVDLQKSIVYLISGPFTSPIRKRQINILIDTLNEKTYRRRLSKRVIDSEAETLQLLNFYGLKRRQQQF